MRKNSGDMEIALEVPQPRLRAVPATETASPPLDASDPPDADLLRRNGPTADAELPELVSGEPDPSQQAQDSEVSWRVHRALEELQPREREVIELAYWSGMSQSEVAEYLGLPLGTVKTRTRSGLARLASALEGELR